MFTITVLDGANLPRNLSRVNFFFADDPRIKSDDQYTTKKGVAIFYEGFVKTGAIKVYVDSKYVGTYDYKIDGNATVTS